MIHFTYNFKILQLLKYLKFGNEMKCDNVKKLLHTQVCATKHIILSISMVTLYSVRLIKCTKNNMKNYSTKTQICNIK